MTSKTEELTDKIKELFKQTRDGDYDRVKRLLSEESVPVDCLDDQGITPLQEAAYRGNYTLCKLFLDCGANVNSNHHVSGYSSLTFASLSGKTDVVTLLLERGASTTSINSVNRTAAQMAAFVGNHHIVSVINSFVPKQMIDYFTEKHGLEESPKLSAHLSVPLHKMVIMTNTHPVRLAMYIQSNMLLIEDCKKVTRVLNTLCEKQFKEENNELVSLKLHYISFVLNACGNFTKEMKLKHGSGWSFTLEPLIKHWIKGSNDEGFPVILEKFLRQSLREYPYHESPLLQQLVYTLAAIKVGDEPSAISIMAQAIGGQRSINNNESCATCGEPKPDKKCSACKYVQYCDKYCQKLHWFTHKTICNILAKKYSLQQKVTEDSKDSKLSGN